MVVMYPPVLPVTLLNQVPIPQSCIRHTCVRRGPIICRTTQGRHISHSHVCCQLIAVARSFINPSPSHREGLNAATLPIDPLQPCGTVHYSRVIHVAINVTWSSTNPGTHPPGMHQASAVLTMGSFSTGPSTVESSMSDMLAIAS